MSPGRIRLAFQLETRRRSLTWFLLALKVMLNHVNIVSAHWRTQINRRRRARSPMNGAHPSAYPLYIRVSVREYGAQWYFVLQTLSSSPSHLQREQGEGWRGVQQLNRGHARCIVSINTARAGTPEEVFRYRGHVLYHHKEVEYFSQVGKHITLCHIRHNGFPAPSTSPSLIGS